MTEVDFIEYQTAGTVPEDIGEFSCPVVLKGFIDHWPAVKEAKKSDGDLVNYLQTFAVDIPVTVYKVKPGVTGNRIGYLDDFTGFTFDRGAGLLNEILPEMLAEGSSSYIGSTKVGQWLPGFGEQNDLNFTGCQPTANFWIGNATDIAAHFDSPLNIACCVSGRRAFTLFPPEQVANLYIGPPDRTPSGRSISMVDFENPDWTKFPRFKEAMQTALTAELGPGDALFIPPLWWHRVKSTEQLNMLVNYWWKETSDHMGVPDLALEHALLTIRGMSQRDKKAWKALFDYYIFSEQEVALEQIPEHLTGVLDASNEQAARVAWHNFSKRLKS